MKVSDFFKAVDGARSLCENIQDEEVKVRLIGSNGVTISDHFDLTRVGYKFSPIRRVPDGAMVLEIKVN